MKIQEIRTRDKVIQYIKTLDSPKICEVGTRTADFFYKWMFADNCELGIMVDIWQNTEDPNQNDNSYSQAELDSQYREVFQETLKHPNARIIREFSDKACNFFPDETFDFVYLDADHSYKGCLRDLRCWNPKVKKGGILAGHDYIDAEMTIRMGHRTVFGVVPAVTEFLEEKNIENELIHITSETYGTYFIRRS